jgi:hypothetical protein
MQEEWVIELMQEDEDDEVDELAGYEGKPWHPSMSPCTHACHTSPSLTDPGRDSDGPSAKDTIRFQARRYACLDPGVAGWSAHKLNS